MINHNGRYLINGDAAAIPLAPRSVNCIATSPPYWSLRRYPGSQDRPWPAGEYSPMPGVPPIPVDAWTGPLGLEPTPELFVWHLVLVFRECRRVLRDDGVMWVVIGDSYASQGGPEPAQTKWQVDGASITQNDGKSRTSGRLQPGDLVGIPHRLQFALQADGWVIRNDVIWHKSNPMPESVSGQRWERCRAKVQGASPDDGANYRQGTDHGYRPHSGDLNETPTATWQPCPGCPKCEEHGGYVLRRGSWRHTRAHEVVLMCVKSMGYWADQEVVREAYKETSIDRARYSAIPKSGKSATNILQEGDGNMLDSGIGRYTAGLLSHEINLSAGRNPRSVVTPKPESYSGAHYAAYPTSLIAPLIRATCPSRCCPVCGAGWSPVVERNTTFESGSGKAGNKPDGKYKEYEGTGLIGEKLRMGPTPHTNVLGYRPSCDCGREDWQPGIVFDPFLGSGTTLKVAHGLMLRGVGLDLAHTYLDEQAKVRAQVGAPSGALDGLPMFLGLDTD